MLNQVYHSSDIQAWEQRWFAQQNNPYGLMQQVAWLIHLRLVDLLRLNQIKKIAVCCGQGNNGGDGYLIASYLKLAGFDIDIYSSGNTNSTMSSAAQARTYAIECGVNIQQNFEFDQPYDAYIDALFGIGLNRELDATWQTIIQTINLQSGLKISIDIPSGLHANTGQPLPCAVQADYTYTVLANKVGLYTGQGKAYVGLVSVIAAIPVDQHLKILARLCTSNMTLPKRQAFGHKGTYGHVLVVGGHEDMGGAVIMAAEAAFASGAGKVTVVCHPRHHTAVLARSPNIMVRNIHDYQDEALQNLIHSVDAICFGMGLGRDVWAERIYESWMPLLQSSNKYIILDADALWFLAKHPIQLTANVVATPHPGEAATLLAQTTQEIEQNRILAIQNLQQKYSGQWVLKGAGSLILESNDLWICPFGNAGMGTGGMGDVLAGMIAGLKVQDINIPIHEVVTLHALAGDKLAESGQRGLQAYDMKDSIYKVVNVIDS